MTNTFTQKKAQKVSGQAILRYYNINKKVRISFYRRQTCKIFQNIFSTNIYNF